ncbi:MAG: nuclear transport factor 2 family protein [Rhodoferax sp.]|nr:nuclear transport factor 2 family protein [Rhodoferax sp.]
MPNARQTPPMPGIIATEDRLAIRELMDAYGDAVCRRNAEDWVATWAPDGHWSIRGQEIAGRAALRTVWCQAMTAYKFVSFTSYPGALWAEGDTVHARVQTTEWLTPVQGRVRRQHGTYDDRLVKLAGRWYFAHRRFSVNEMQEF